MPAKKKVVRKNQQVAHVPSSPEPPPSMPDGPTGGPVQISADPERKMGRLRQRLIQAEDESAEYAAIADGLLEENNQLKEQVRRLTETVREFEQKAFSEEEQTEEAK